MYGYDVLDGGRLVSYSNGVDPPEVFGYDAAGFLAVRTRTATWSASPTTSTATC